VESPRSESWRYRSLGNPTNLAPSVVVGNGGPQIAYCRIH
jgi:hypothetical protein